MKVTLYDVKCPKCGHIFDSEKEIKPEGEGQIKVFCGHTWQEDGWQEEGD